MKISFDESIYSSVSLTKLTIFAISKIVENGEECAYERVVNECFTLFPKRFSLQSVLVQRELDNYCSRASEYIAGWTLGL